MSEALDELFLFGEEKMEKAIIQLKKEFGSIRSGRANPLILDKVMVDYYGAPTQLRQMSQVSVQDGTTLVITPYDKSVLKEIEKAIIKAEIGITPNSDGICIRLTFPPLTEERRKEIVKDVKKLGEEAKVAVRNVRRDMTDDLKNKKPGASCSGLYLETNVRITSVCKARCISRISPSCRVRRADDSKES